MNNKLYLDNIKIPEDEEFIVVRSYEEAIAFIKRNGIPSFISFNHYLGCNEEGNTLPSGYDFAKWLVEMDIKKLYLFPSDFKFNVHSACAISRNNIRGLLNNYLLFNTNIYHKDIN